MSGGASTGASDLAALVENVGVVIAVASLVLSAVANVFEVSPPTSNRRITGSRRYKYTGGSAGFVRAMMHFGGWALFVGFFVILAFAWIRLETGTAYLQDGAVKLLCQLFTLLLGAI
jgi:hypothetical protein